MSESFELGPRSHPKQRSMLLTLIDRCGGVVEGRTKLMKLCFLLEHYDDGRLREREAVGAFTDFFIYDHGPFSRDVMNAFNDLRQDGLVREESGQTIAGDRRFRIELTADGRRETTGEPPERLNEVVEAFGNQQGTELETQTLDMLGVEREEKSQYRHMDVSELIAQA